MPHERNEQRSLALHRMIADKLRRQPELLQIPRANLERWIARGGRSLPHLRRWQELLAGPFEQLLERIQEDNEEMRDLRQSTPFAGVLEPRERWRVYETDGTGTHHSGGRNHR